MKEKFLIKLKNIYSKKIFYNHKLKWDRYVLNQMKECKLILDVGCGSGRFISQLPEKIIGIDINKDTLRHLKKNGFNVKYGEATDLQFDDKKFDGVHCSDLIEHLYPAQAYKLLKEVDRVLKIGGLLCIRSPLLHTGFYNDFTHIKPYNPESILHYLKIKKQEQTTFPEINGYYKIKELKYKKAQIFSDIHFTPLWFLKPIFNILYRVGITSFKKIAYMLILEKIC